MTKKKLTFRDKKTESLNTYSVIALHDQTDTTNGDNLLHTIVKQAKDAYEFGRYFAQLDPQAALKLARTVNNQGQLPLNVIASTSLTSAEKRKIYKILLDLILQAKIKKQSEPVDVNEVLGRYDYDVESTIAKNLIFACQLANETRALIQNSFTHPDCNGFSPKKNAAIDEKLSEAKTQYHQRIYKNGFFHPLRAFSDGENMLLETIHETIAEKKIGNCGEHSYIVKYLATKLDKTIPVQIMHIGGGDHDVICIGTGNDRVICDSWTGDVFPLNRNEVEKRLLCFELLENTPYGEPKRITKHFNPNYNQLIVDKTLANRVGKVQAGIAGLGLFAIPVLASLTMQLGSYLGETSSNGLSKS